VLQIDVAGSSPDTLAHIATFSIVPYPVFAQRHDDPNNSDLRVCRVLIDGFSL